MRTEKEIKKLGKIIQDLKDVNADTDTIQEIIRRLGIKYFKNNDTIVW